MEIGGEKDGDSTSIPVHASDRILTMRCQTRKTNYSQAAMERGGEIFDKKEGRGGEKDGDSTSIPVQASYGFLRNSGAAAPMKRGGEIFNKKKERGGEIFNKKKERGGEKDGDSTSIVIHDLEIAEAVKSSITQKLVDHSPLPASCCIFRVPPVILRQKTEAYTPDVVSIGPFHRKLQLVDQQFQLMENVKRWYLQSLLKLRPDLTLDSLIKAVTELNFRACYSEKFDDIGDVEFVEMMILDGCFLLELFRKTLLWRRNQFEDKNDPILNLDYMEQYLYHDLLLLENQLPWFVLVHLYELTSDKAASLPELVINFFRQQESNNIRQVDDESHLSRDEVFHILDLIRTDMVASFNESEEERDKDEQHEKEAAWSPQRIPNATTLSEAGIKFKKSEDTSCIMNISFQNGVLTIPHLLIDETTSPLFRNLIAYEQCHYARVHKITSYAVLMDSLIDTSKDVDLLCEKGILVNWLSPEDASKFFNDLYNDTAVVGFYYKGLCKDVNNYYNQDWNKWMEKLRREYFSNPWAVISFIAALILLGLTLLQTIFTVLQF